MPVLAKHRDSGELNGIGRSEQLSYDDAVKFLRHRRVANDPLYVAWWLGLVTGLPRGELHGLRSEDLDFGQGVIYIRRRRLQVGGGVVERPMVPSTRSLDPDTCTLLDHHGRAAYVVTDPRTGEPYRQMSTFLAHLRRSCRNAGVPEVSYDALCRAADPRIGRAVAAWVQSS